MLLMNPILKPLAQDNDVIRLQGLLAANGYFKQSIPAMGLVDQITFEAVELFQTQHVSKAGQSLDIDGVVGNDTWWALENASGAKQRNHFNPVIPKGVSAPRIRLLELVLGEHRKPVLENPNGSNRSPDIDGYWGDTGLKGYAWCCAFVSWALVESIGDYPMEKHHVGVQNMSRAAKRLALDTDKPKPGDIFVQLFAGGKGHTGFVLGVSPDGDHIYTVEGNCSNRIKAGKRKQSTITHYIDIFRDDESLNFARADIDVMTVDKDANR
jgi:hypothetical protein